MPALKVDKLEGLVACLYEAALRPAQWREVLNATSDAFGADSAAVFTDPMNATLGSHWSEGMDEFADWILTEGPRLHNPRPERALRCGRPGQALTESQLFTEWELTHLPFNVGMVDEQGLRWEAGGNVGTVGTPVFLTVQRRADKDRFQRADLDALEALFPHLRRSAEIAFVMARVHAAGVMDGLNATGSAAILLDYAGRPCHLNAQAEALLGVALRIERGKLLGIDRAANRALQQVIAAAIAPKPLGRHDKFPVAALPRAGASALLVQGLPLAGSAGDLFQRAKAILVIKDPDAGVPVDARALRQLFGLTPAEVRIACGIAEGQNLQALAANLGIEIGTARVHLKAVMQKTGTHRQAEVAALLARLTALVPSVYPK